MMTYKRKLFKAQDGIERGVSVDFWRGYLEGLERRRAGGTGSDHLESLQVGADIDPSRIEFLEGYKEGFGY